MAETPTARAIPPKAVGAAASLLHDFECPDRCEPQAMGTFIRRAQKLLEAAAPHMTCCEYDGCDCQVQGRDRERQRIRDGADKAKVEGCWLYMVPADLLGDSDA